jgi:hypothetical protein
MPLPVAAKDSSLCRAILVFGAREAYMKRTMALAVLLLFFPSVREMPSRGPKMNWAL